MGATLVQSVVSLAPTRDPVIRQLATRVSLTTLSIILIIVIIIGQSALNGHSLLAWASSKGVPVNHEGQVNIQLCEDCRIFSQSIDRLVRRPRQMDVYGQFDDKFNLEKIKKYVCKDLINDLERERCRQFYFNNQDSVLKWKQTASTTAKTLSFFDFVCIREHKLCCPQQSFGLTCSKCPKCASNEYCYGEGTRTGNGTCICREGHHGIACNECLPGYYQDPKVQGTAKNFRTLCKKCHKSCQYCRTDGPKGCEVCRDGYSWQAGFGCLDIDECIKSDNKICGPNTFCVNTEGSYFCYECDRACDGCHGDGPDMCLKCGRGYKLDDNRHCVAKRKTILPPEANYYRYAIYAGLCVCTCIILHNNVYLASLIGLGVALYIGASEYVMSGQPGAHQGGTNNLVSEFSNAHSSMSFPHLDL